MTQNRIIVRSPNGDVDITDEVELTSRQVELAMLRVQVRTLSSQVKAQEQQLQRTVAELEELAWYMWQEEQSAQGSPSYDDMYDDDEEEFVVPRNNRRY